MIDTTHPRQTILGTCPSKSNCYKIIKLGNHASLAKQDVLKRYEDSFFIQCSHYRGKMIDGYFELHIDVFYPNQRADLDNAMKVVLDTLQHRVKAIKNDNKCVKIVASKYLDKNNPRIEFQIKQV